MISRLYGGCDGDMDCPCMKGEGVLFRDPGKLPPKARKLLSEIGNEKVTSIQLVRTPLKRQSIINWITGGMLDKAKKDLNVDEVFHLSMLINGKYVLEKNEVINLATNPNIVEQDSETLIVPITNDVTIEQMIENTRKQMGDANFSNYNAENNNCSVFISNVLSSNGLNNDNTETFVNQKAREIISKFPEFAKYFINAVTDTAAAVDRTIQGEGEPYIHNFGLKRCVINF